MEVLKSRKQIEKMEKKRSIIIRFVFIIAVFFEMLLSIVLFNNTGNKIVLKLNGQEKEKLTVNTEYEDKGFLLKVNNQIVENKDISYNIINNIDNKVLGDYEVIYDITYKNKNYKLIRKVNVVDDQKPVISGVNDEIEIYYCNKDEKINLNYIAEDNYDGIITDKVTVDRKENFITLTVVDSSGNIEMKNVRIKISDEQVPVIKLIGNDLVYVKVGSKYNEKGAISTDGCGKKIDNANIKIESNVDTENVGEYEVNYTVTTKSGLVSSAVRKVIVYNEVDTTNILNNKKKVVYLTFDDGPGAYTEELLDILKKYNVKATFFVTNQFKKYVPIIKREYEEGHAIGVHTLTHKWSIYKSVETYIKDFNDMNNIIYTYTGKKSDIFRFPGGSSNTISRSYATGVVKAIKNKMTDDGYVYFDWNVDSQDAAGANTKKIIKNVTKGMDNHSYSVVLMHDIKKNTLNGIEDIINYGLAHGYTFETLNQASPTVHHRINN